MEYTLKPDFVFSLGGKANTGKVCITKDIVFNKGKVIKNVGGCLALKENISRSQKLHI